MTATPRIVDLRPVWRTEEERATRSAICPMCHVFIAKHRSWIVKLPRPLAPRAVVADYNPRKGRCADTGRPWYANGRLPSLHKRWMVHRACFKKAVERVNEEYGTDYRSE